MKGSDESRRLCRDLPVLRWRADGPGPRILHPGCGGRTGRRVEDPGQGDQRLELRGAGRELGQREGEAAPGTGGEPGPDRLVALGLPGLACGEGRQLGEPASKLGGSVLRKLDLVGKRTPDRPGPAPVQDVTGERKRESARSVLEVACLLERL